VVIGVVFLLAVVGLISGISFLSGASLGGSSKSVATGNTNAPATATAIVVRSRAEAGSIVRDARKQSRQLLAVARKEAKRIKGSGNGHHHVVATATPTASIAPSSPLPAPTPIPTPTIAGAPNLSGVPASWLIVVFGVNPQAGTLSIVNRSTAALSGRVVITYVKSNGRVLGVRTASFVGVAGRSVAALTTSRVPAGWSRYRISVTDVR
jgi:hypothetical protein